MGDTLLIDFHFLYINTESSSGSIGMVINFAQWTLQLCLTSFVYAEMFCGEELFIRIIGFRSCDVRRITGIAKN